MKKRNDALSFGCSAILMIAFLYLVIASTVFRFRHPWATETEQMIYIGRALTFQTVPYDEARPRRNSP